MHHSCRAAALVLVGAAAATAWGQTAPASTPKPQQAETLRTLVSWDRLRLETGNERIPSIDVKAEVRYQWSSLMGGFMERYALRWQPLSVQVVGRDAVGRKTQATWLANEAGAPLGKVEVLVEGELGVGLLAFRRFNTGQQVRSGVWSSDIPGNPSWDEVWTHRATRCAAGKHPRMPADDAKSLTTKILKAPNSYSVNFMGLCPGSTPVSNLAPLLAALEQACAAGGLSGPFCVAAPAPRAAASQPRQAEAFDPFDDSKKKTEAAFDAFADKGSRPHSGESGGKPVSIAEALDDQADRPKRLARLQQLKGEHETASRQQCRATVSRIEACIAEKGCAAPAPAGYTAAECEAVRNHGEPRGGGFTLFSSDCDRECRDAHREKQDAEHQRALATWRASPAGRTHMACKPYYDAGSHIAACRKQQEPVCNPAGVTESRCMAAAQARAPTEADALALMKRERAAAPAARRNTPFD